MQITEVSKETMAQVFIGHTRGRIGMDYGFHTLKTPEEDEFDSKTFPVPSGEKASVFFGRIKAAAKRFTNNSSEKVGLRCIIKYNDKVKQTEVHVYRTR